jgi:DNA-binding transcriptional regulator YhcF (GntR family)
MAFPPPAAARYLQVKQFVLARISAGTLAVGDRVPSENELVRELEVSRMTANRALRELAADGVLVRVAGVGTFVAEQRAQSHPLEVRNIADEIRLRGHEYLAKVVSHGSITAARELAERCGVAPGAKLDHTLLVHFEGGVPLQVEDREPDRGTRLSAKRLFPHHAARIPHAGRAAAARRAYGSRHAAGQAHQPPVEARGWRRLPPDHAAHLEFWTHRHCGGSISSRLSLRAVRRFSAEVIQCLTPKPVAPCVPRAAP